MSFILFLVFCYFAGRLIGHMMSGRSKNTKPRRK